MTHFRDLSECKTAKRISFWKGSVILVVDSFSRHKMFLIEGSLEVKLLTIWTDEKQSQVGRVRGEKMQMREKDRKGRKVAKHCVFPMICGSGW
jgi:hypothetical protein